MDKHNPTSFHVKLEVHAIAVNRLSGIDFPLWSPRKHPASLPRPQMV
jgi:hypothetical protein